MSVVNVKFAGLGGTGVIKASDVMAELVFEQGYDVKKAEVHGMSQRGGSIASDVRFAKGEEVQSPMIPTGEADYLVVFDETQVVVNEAFLKQLFLCSDKAGFITGENICVDGGMTKLMIYHDDHGWKYEK